MCLTVQSKTIDLGGELIVWSREAKNPQTSICINTDRHRELRAEYEQNSNWIISVFTFISLQAAIVKYITSKVVKINWDHVFKGNAGLSLECEARSVNETHLLVKDLLPLSDTVALAIQTVWWSLLCPLQDGRLWTTVLHAWHCFWWDRHSYSKKNWTIPLVSGLFSLVEQGRTEEKSASYGFLLQHWKRLLVFTVYWGEYCLNLH